MCVYNVCPEQPIPKLLLFLNTRSVLLLLSVFPPNVSASERRKLLVAELPNLLSQVCRAQSSSSCLGSTLWHEAGCDTRLAGEQAQHPPCREKAKKGGIQCIQIHTRGKTIFWHFERLYNSLIASGEVPAAGEARASTGVGSVSLPQTALTSMPGEPSPALGYSCVTPFPEPHLQGLGSLTAAKGQKNWEPDSTPAHVQWPPSVGRAADVHLMAAVAANGLGTDWVALSNSAKFHS